MRTFIVVLLVSGAAPGFAQTTQPEAAPAEAPAAQKPPQPEAPQAQAPDPRLGERYDGRPQRPSAKKYLLAVPRVILGVPRLVMKSVAAVAKPVMEWSERERVPETITSAITSWDGLIGVRPVIDYQLAFRPSGGMLYFNNRFGGGAGVIISSATGGAEVMLHNVDFFVPLKRVKSELRFHADYIRRDDQLFAGIGMESKLPFARYAVDEIDASLRYTWAPAKLAKLDFAVDGAARRFGNGSPYGGDRSMAEVYCAHLDGMCPARNVSSALVPGFATGTQFVRESVGLRIDNRREETSSGLMADLAVSYTHGFAGDDSSYLGVRGHVGAQFNVWRHRSLYLGISAQDLVAFGSSPIPFTELAQLGGVDDLRGFATGRFRGASTVLAQLEWRWPVWMWMDGVLFADYGGAFGPQFRGFAFGDLRPDIGLGLRVHSSNKYLIRVQVAYGFGDNAGFRVVIAGNGNPS
jgi:hypothetical protein